ncbi:MAG: hypothetical protein DRO05_02250 [Thermoproteota archaeon]|nr:MAG: hypothetical protein DRO05_02250 [Candidatus Korarchaeota archaeon]
MIRREEVVGKLVVDAEAKVIGKVVDIVIGQDGTAQLLAEAEVRRGSKTKRLEFLIPHYYVSKIGDVVLLSAEAEVRKR